MKRSITAAIVVTTLAISAGANARGHKQPCQYSDLYTVGCERDLVRFLQRLNLTAGQKDAIDELHSAAEQQRNSRQAQSMQQRQGVISLDPADPDYNHRATQLAEQKGERVEQKLMHAAALQAQVYELLTLPQRVAYNELRNDWAQGRQENQRRKGEQRSRPTARNWASTSIRF